jgi:iron complex transport system ATP-binding protein
MNDLLTARQLSLQIGGSLVCQGLDLCIRAGESWALLGRNGVGKSTLLHHLAGLRRGHRGELWLGSDRLEDLAPRARARRVSVLLQHSNPGFGASVLEAVLTGRHPHLPTLAWEGADDLGIARRAIASLGLEDLSNRSLSTLSGGELRRVEIARLLTQDCPLALLDEPLNHLDLAHQAGCLRVLGERCVGAGRGMMMALHDLNIAYQTCPNWLILNGDGEWTAGPRDVLADPVLLSRAYAHPISRIDTPSGPLFRPDYPHPVAGDDDLSRVQ